MRFSMMKLLMVVNVLALLFALSFAMPIEYGFPILLVISGSVIPPVLLVGAFVTQGRRRAFILGCMIGGTPHFVFNSFCMLYLVFSDMDISDLFSSSSEWQARWVTLIGYGIGLLGGFSGLVAYSFWQSENEATS